MAICNETIHSMLRRCFNWDYRRPGTYIVTLTLADRSRDWLGRLVGDEAAGWAIELTPLGEIVERCWRELAENWPGVEPREAQVMPEHFHGILRVNTPQKHPLGQIIGSFKAKATAAARALAAEQARRETDEQAHEGPQAPPGPRAPHVPTSLRAPHVPTSLLAGSGLFSPSFQDTILWDLKRYRNERDYLFANPSRLAVKRAHPELFKVVRDLAVKLAPHAPPGPPAPQAPPGPRAPHVPTSLLAGSPRAHFSAIGNHFLLEKSLFQVQCSRRDFAYRRVAKAAGQGLEIARGADGEPLVAVTSPAFEARREAALVAAAKGAVLISPCVSDGERQIAREALAAGLALITLQNKGFAPLQKPSGRYFDACAAGRLLMLAPAAWPYQPGHKPMTRDDATAMNRLCQWLAGENAATINYHGLQPANIDALAAAAAKIG